MFIVNTDISFLHRSKDETLESLRLDGALERKEFQVSLMKFGQQIYSRLPQWYVCTFFAFATQLTQPRANHTSIGASREFISTAHPQYQMSHPPSWKPEGVMGNTQSITSNVGDEVISFTKGKERVQDTPASTRASTPEADEPEAVPATTGPETPQDDAHPIRLGKMSPKPQNKVGLLHDQIAAMRLYSTAKNNERPSTTSTSSNLESYILRPLVNSSPYSTVWSTEIGPLGLDNQAMLAHIDSLGPDYSVVDALMCLPAEPLRLIQQYAEKVCANIVSVKQTAAVDMATQMGTFQIRPIIFILAHPKEKVLETLKNTTNVFESKAPVASGSPWSDVSLFQRNGPIQENRFVAPTLPPPTTKPFFFNPHHDPHEHERGKDVFFVEKDHIGEHRYTTITMGNKCSCADNSLEELRVKDYNAGRTGPRFSDDLPFGGQYSNPKSGVSHFTGPAANPSLFQNAGTGGFNTQTQNTGSLFRPAPVQQQPTSNIFAQIANGPFGNPAPVAQGQNPFENPSPPGGRGLFGYTGPPQQQYPPKSVFGQPSVVGPQFSCWGAPVQTHTTSTGQASTVTSGGLFGGGRNTISGGLFRAPMNNSNTLTGLFGAPPVAPSTGLFGIAPGSSSNTGGLFGNVASQPRTSLFGRPTQDAPASTQASPPAYAQAESSTAPEQHPNRPVNPTMYNQPMMTPMPEPAPPAPTTTTTTTTTNTATESTQLTCALPAPPSTTTTTTQSPAQAVVTYCKKMLSESDVPFY